MSQPIASTSSEGCSAPKRHCGDNNKPTRPLPMNLWNLAKMIDTDEKAIVFSQSYGLLPYYSWCPTCHARLFPYQKKASRRKDAFYYRFQCQKYPCRKARTPNEVGLKKGTWFERSKVSMQKSLVLVYCFAAKFSHDETIRQSSLEAITSPETVVDFFNYCREVCVEALFGDTAEQPIGGPNYNVEIGEAKISKKKFNRGCLVEGQWVLGGICRETKDCFLVPVEDRTETILIDLIKQHVSVGTVIHTNCFSSSDRLKEEGYRHLTVNNSENLVDPEIGASTNLIESTLWSVRKELPIGWTPKRSFIGHLAEFIWRRRNRGQDAFLALLRDIGKVFPGPGPALGYLMAAVGNDCYFFFTSTCAKGEACPFRHVESAKTSRIICQHWQTTGCLRPMCKFRHSDFHVQVNYSEIPCYWENQPVGCNKPNCAYKHNKPRPDFKAAVAPQLKPASPEEKENGRTKNEAGSEIVDQFVMPTVKPVIIDPESEASNSSPVKKPPSKDTVNTSEKEKESSVIDDKEKEEKRTGTEIGKKKKTGVLAKKKGKLGTTPKVVKKVKKKVEGSPAATIVPLKRKRVSNAETERGDAVPVKKKVKDRLGVIPNTQKKAEESVEEEESSSSSSSDSDDSIENVKVLSMEEIFRQKALESMMKKRAAEGKPMLPAYGTSQKKSGPVSSRLSKPVIPNNRPKQPVTFDNRPKTAVTTGNRQKKTTVVANSRLNKPAVIKKKPKVPSPPPTPELESEGEDEGDETGEEEEEKEDEATNEDEKDESSSTESESSSSESSDSESGEVRRVVVNLDAEKAAREKAKASLAKRPHGVIRRPESTTTTSTISKKRRVVRDEQPISSSAQQRLSIKERLGKPISSSVSSVIVGRSVTKRVSSSSSSEEAEEEGGEGSNVDNEDDNESISDVKIKSLDEIREEKLARLGHSPIKDRLGPEKTVDEDVEKNGRQILLSEDVNSQKKARKRPWSSGSRQKKTKVVQEVGGEEDQRTVSATSPVESEPVERVPKLQIDEEEPECLFESLKRRAFLKKTQQLSENVPSDTKDDESDGVEKVEEEDDDEGVGGKRKKHKHKHKHKKHKKSKSERQIYVPPAKKHVITEVLEKVKKMPSLLSGREDLLEFEDRANVKNNKPTSTNASTAVESVQQRPKPRAAAMWAAGLTVSSKGIGARPYLRKGMDVEKNDSDDEDKAPFQRSSLTTSKLSSSSVTSASVKDNSRSAVPVVKTFSQIMAEKRQKRMQAEEGSGPRSSDARINSPDHSISSPSRLSSRADNSKPRAPITPIRFDVDGVSKAEQPSFPKLSNTSILNRGGPSKSATSSISMSSRAPFAVATKSHKSPINKDNVNSSLSSSSTLPVSDIRPAYKTARAKKLFNKKAASKTISEASPASDSPAHISKLSVDDSTPSVDNVQHHHHHCHHHTENTSASGDATVALKSPTGDEKKQRRASTATESHQKRSSLDDEFSFFDGGEDIEDISDIVGKDVEPIDDLLQDIDDLLA